MKFLSKSDSFYYLGPDYLGYFQLCKISSMHSDEKEF